MFLMVCMLRHYNKRKEWGIVIYTSNWFWKECFSFWRTNILDKLLTFAHNDEFDKMIGGDAQEKLVWKPFLLIISLLSLEERNIIIAIIIVIVKSTNKLKLLWTGEAQRPLLRFSLATNQSINEWMKSSCVQPIYRHHISNLWTRGTREVYFSCY